MLNVIAQTIVEVIIIEKKYRNDNCICSSTSTFYSFHIIVKILNGLILNVNKCAIILKFIFNLSTCTIINANMYYHVLFFFNLVSANIKEKQKDLAMNFVDNNRNSRILLIESWFLLLLFFYSSKMYFAQIYVFKFNLDVPEIRVNSWLNEMVLYGRWRASDRRKDSLDLKQQTTTTKYLKSIGQPSF